MIGIDIGSKFIKVCKIVNVDTKRKEYSVFSAMKSVIGLEEIDKIQVLFSLLKKLGIEKESSYLAIGGRDVISRDVVLQNSNLTGNLLEIVTNEVGSSISDNLNGMYKACGIVKNISDKETGILFSAAYKNKINSKINIVSGIKDIFVKGVTMEALALANAFECFGPSYKNNESIVLLNIGYETSNIVVLNNKELVFTKDIDFGGQNITKDIATSYMIPEKLAEEIKVNADLKQKINFNMKNILKRTTSSVIEFIFRTIEYCITRQFVISVDRIVITGGGALTEGIDSFIEETLGVPTIKWNPLIDNNFVGYTNKDCGYFLPISLGLALEKEQK